MKWRCPNLRELSRGAQPLRATIIASAAGILMLATAAGAQEPPAMTPPVPSNSAPPVPLFPTLSGKSSIDYFRELLAMSPVERRAALTNRPPAIQQQLLAKVREYESLTPDQRELRLQATELRFYLWPLLNTSPTNRPARLALIPDEERTLIEARLGEWDKLSPEDRKQLLENEAAVRYLTELAATPSAAKATLLTNMPAMQRQRVQAGLKKWQSLSEPQRHAVTEQFNRFFDLTAAEQRKTLGKISEPERRQIERTLRTYQALPANQRAKCVRAFEKFANLSAEEREQFLQSAEQWKQMTPSEREAWKNLVNNVRMLPPLPPRLRMPVRPPPPPS